MQATEAGEWQRGVDVKRRARFGCDTACAVLFYAAVLVQVILFIMVFAQKNSDMIELSTGACPDGMVYSMTCSPAFRPIVGGHGKCVSEGLCEEIRSTCASRRLDELSPKQHLELLAAEEGPGSNARRLMRERARRLLASGGADPRQLLNAADVPDNLWDFMEQYVYQPITLFLVVFVATGLWLLALKTFPRTMVWGTIIADIVFLLAAFIWFKAEVDTWNIPCVALAVVGAIAAVLLRKQIDQCAVIMKAAMEGLSAAKRVFIVCAGVVCLWLAFFAMWIAAVICMHFALEVVVNDAGQCELQQIAYFQSPWMYVFFVLMIYWVTYFFRNVNLIIVATTMSGWYFNNENFSSFWIRSLRWGFVDLAGGNAIASATMGLASYLLNKVGSAWKVCFACLNPLDWIALLLALCLHTILHALTKFGLIAQAYSGKPFCEAAFSGMKLLKLQLGPAVLTDFIGTRVMSWVTYVIAVCIAFAAWAWGDSLQGITTLGDLDGGLIIVMVIGMAWLLSYPFYTLILVIVIEMLLDGVEWSGCLECRAVMNSLFVSLFIGAVTFFILTNVSYIVVNAMDAIFFCFAVENNLNEAKQDRFAALYDSVKATIKPGVAVGQAVVGAPVNSQPLAISIPEGQGPGAVLQVKAPQGHMIQVTVPEGYSAGQVLTVSVPNDPSQPVTLPPGQPAPAAANVTGAPVSNNAQG